MDLDLTNCTCSSTVAADILWRVGAHETGAISENSTCPLWESPFILIQSYRLISASPWRSHPWSSCCRPTRPPEWSPKAGCGCSTVNEYLGFPVHTLWIFLDTRVKCLNRWITFAYSHVITRIQTVELHNSHQMIFTTDWSWMPMPFRRQETENQHNEHLTSDLGNPIYTYLSFGSTQVLFINLIMGW